MYTERFSHIDPAIAAFLRRTFALILAVTVLWAASRGLPAGGEIWMPDFKEGVVIYVEEGYSQKLSGPLQPAETEPHFVWQVTGEVLRQEILDLCREIKQYREAEKSRDIMLGFSQSFEFPRIYLEGEKVFYSIEILNWENYSGNQWSSLPIRQERFGQPTIHIFRADLSAVPEGQALYIYARINLLSDTLNDEGGYGWFSSMAGEDMDRLLGLLESIGPGNAVIAEEIGQR